jgi:ABC-2 type transport system ATP-binding protein
MTCEQVIIIHKGRVVAKNTTQALARELSGGEIIELYVRPNPHGITVASLVELLGAHAGVRQSEYGVLDDGLNQIIIESDGSEDLRPSIARSVVDAGCELFQLEKKTKTLEDVFAHLTLDDSTPESKQADEEVA